MTRPKHTAIEIYLLATAIYYGDDWRNELTKQGWTTVGFKNAERFFRNQKIAVVKPLSPVYHIDRDRAFEVLYDTPTSPRYVVDGMNPQTGDWETDCPHAPFVVFDVLNQENLPTTYTRHDDAMLVAEAFNRRDT